MGPGNPSRVFEVPRQFAGILLAVGLMLAIGAPVVAAAATPPPPELIAVDELKGGDINITWRAASMFVSGARGIRTAVNPGGLWGLSFNVYIEQTGERVQTETWAPYTPDEYDANTRVRTYHPASTTFFNNHGNASETRYCIRMQAYLGDGTSAGSVFSAESNQKCVGTQRILIITPSQGPSPFGDPVPPPPTKPDLTVTRVTGPTEIFDGVTAIYEVVLWNDGTPARGTAQVLVGLLSPIEPVELIGVPDGFTCDLSPFGYSCIGSLGGVDDAVQTRGALFKVQVRGNGPGAGGVYGSANHDRSVDEMTVDNNFKLLPVTVK